MAGFQVSTEGPSSEIKKDRDRDLLDAIARILRKKFSSAERLLYVSHLVHGSREDETGGGQRLLADVLKSTFTVSDWALSPPTVSDLAKRCHSEKNEVGDRVAAYLERILAAEQLLAPSVSFFGYLLSSDGQTVDDVARSVKKQWGKGLRTVDVAGL